MFGSKTQLVLVIAVVCLGAACLGYMLEAARRRGASPTPPVTSPTEEASRTAPGPEPAEEGAEDAGPAETGETLLASIVVPPVGMASTAAQADLTPEAAAVWTEVIPRKLAAMRLRDKVGQALMVGIPGGWSASSPGIIGDVPVGAVILYKRNVTSRSQMVGLIGTLKAVQSRTSDLKPFIAIDHEGGRVNRLPSPAFTAYPSNHDMARRADPEEAVRAEGAVMARELVGAGIHMDLAPVVDVCTNPANSDIGDRSYGSDTALTRRLGVAFIEGAQSHGLFVVAKHFPGYGPIARNPHEDLPLVGMPREKWETVHRPPFEAAIDAGVTGVMTGHVVYNCLDDTGTPASLSSAVTTGLLRQEMGFGGLVMTDDLEMGAIAKDYGVPDAAVMALRAGADMILVCHTPSRQTSTLDALVAAIEKGTVSRERLDDAVRKVLWYKYHWGLWRAGR